MPERSYRILLWSLALTGVMLDQATKYSVFSWLHEVEGHKYSLFEARSPRTDSLGDSIEPQGFHLRASSRRTNEGRTYPTSITAPCSASCAITRRLPIWVLPSSACWQPWPSSCGASRR